MCVAPACITASCTFASFMSEIDPSDNTPSVAPTCITTFLGVGTGEDNRKEGEGRCGALGSTEDVADILRPNDLFPELLLV